ncbi:unnamed protein product [Caenorhabditis bovis]|uniref:PH domain-containing protein n=1 Tax=Caenorhabditis bovis TaxID=2654633 RepID=A0A8S1F7G9_9PELO|nr:unnamed protein product [Caenorhabditis bovis]
MGKKKNRNARNKQQIQIPVEQEIVIPQNDNADAGNQRSSSKSRSVASLNMSYDEMDFDLRAPTSDEKIVNIPSSLPPAPVKHTYQTAFMSSDNVTSARTSPVSHGEQHDEIVVPSSRSRVNSFASHNENLDGGAYAKFRSSQNDLAVGDSVQIGSHSNSRRSLFSDPAEERSIAGFPRNSFGGSRSSVYSRNSASKNENNNNFVEILREDSRGIGEHECLSLPGRSRSTSRASGGFVHIDIVNASLNSHDGMRPRLPRSRTMSESSKQSGNLPSEIPLQSVSQQIHNPDTSQASEGVRTYHADSNCLQQRLSKLSIHTNNDEFVLVGGHPPNMSYSMTDGFTNRTNRSIRTDDTFQSQISSNRNDLSRTDPHELSKVSNIEIPNNYSSTIGLDKNSENDDIGRSISQRSLSESVRSDHRNSRASSRHSVGTTSNTDDRLLLAVRYSQTPEVEGLVPIPVARSRSASKSNFSPDINDQSKFQSRPLSRTLSCTSNASEKVNFADIPTLYSHPEDRFDDNNDQPGVPFRSTSEHQKTPMNVGRSASSSRVSLRDSETNSARIQDPPKALITTSALTPIAKRSASAHGSHESFVMRTPQTVLRNVEPKCIRRNFEPLTKETTEIGIQTGDTIRMRQATWNAMLLSEYATIDKDSFDLTSVKSANFLPKSTDSQSIDTPTKSRLNRPLMNNSFEKNGHPAVSALSKMLQNRIGAIASKSDCDVTSSNSNSSHQITMVQNSASNVTLISDRLRHISERYQDPIGLEIDENENVTHEQFSKGLSNITTSTPSKTNKLSSNWQSDAYQRTGSEKSSIGNISSKSEKDRQEAATRVNVDARWTEGKRTNGDTIRKHIPRGRIRDLASVFESKMLEASTTPSKPPAASVAVLRHDDNRSSAASDRLKRLSGTNSGASSNQLYGSSLSSNAFLQNSQSIMNGESRPRSTSSFTQQPNVFTRNTFVRNSKLGDRTTTTPMASSQYLEGSEYSVGSGNAQGDGGFISMFERIPSIRETNPPPSLGSRYRRSTSVSPKSQAVNNSPGFRQKIEIDRPTEYVHDYRRSSSVAPDRGDVLRRSMPVRDVGNKRETPILRRQTTVFEKTVVKDTMPKTTSDQHFQFGSQVEIPVNGIAARWEKKNAPSGTNWAAYVEIPRNQSPVNVPIVKKAKEKTENDGSNRVNVPITMVGSITDKMNRRTTPIRIERAKTQEVSRTVYQEPKYDTRAVSGDIGEEAAEKSYFEASRDAFGRQTTEDLTKRLNELDSAWSLPQAQRSWKTSSNYAFAETKPMSHTGRNMFEERKRQRELEEQAERERELENARTNPRPLEVSPKLGHNDKTNMYESHSKNFDMTSGLATARPPLSSKYSPPATDDAGSRITHHTMTTHDDAASYVHSVTTGEDSSIRGKIDKMFDFVENDESNRKSTPRVQSTINSSLSVDTVGKGSRYEKKEESPHKKYAEYVTVSQQRANDQHGEWERMVYNENGAKSNSYFNLSTINAVPPDLNAPKRKFLERKLQSPERRNTVAGTDSPTDTFGCENALEYSLTQYREMQREQLRRRVSNVDEPQFFRSPTLTTPHAGQSLNVYKSKDVCETPTFGEKVRYDNSFKGYHALATSTPLDSPQSVLSSSFRSRNDDVNNNMFGNIPQNDTFVSSISGASNVERQAGIRRKINIAANRSLLISRETLRLQKAELHRLHAFSRVRHPPPPIARDLRGSVEFRNISLQLNKNFCLKFTPAQHNIFVFVVLFKCGYQVEATEYVPMKFTSNEVVDRVAFEKYIQFSDLPIDFTVSVEAYAMQVPPVRPVETSLGSFAMKCKKFIGPQPKKTPHVVTETAFKIRGKAILDRDAALERSFYLDHVSFPLEGTISLTTECSRLPEAFEKDFKGFLSMYQTVSNMASWDRYYAVLRRGVVFFWKYPEEELSGKEPRMQIDLTKCTNNSIEKCSADMCPRPWSFSVETLVDTAECTVGSIVEKKRVLLSADSDEMLKEWLYSMNQTLDVIRGPI